MPPAADHESLGPYQLIQELGRGGQGVVWLAEDPRLGRKVALKVLNGLGPGAEEHLARFQREAALASKLDHPGICGVYDTGMAGDVPYIAMRYVKGETLAQHISSQMSDTAPEEPSSFILLGDDDDEVFEDVPEPTSSNHSSSVDRRQIHRLIEVFERIASALHAAHEVGIVHRDIKPGNVMLAESDSQPVILDFGLARDDSDEAGPTLTQTGDLFGTPAYMSPEQISGSPMRIDRRTDIYSLGVTLYECLTMRRPFAEPTREALYKAVLTREPERARKVNHTIPGDLEVVLHCAMEKDRDRRYQTAADFAEDLRRVRAGEPILARKVSIFGRAWRWSKRRPAAAALLMALLLGIPSVSGLGAWWWTHREDVQAQADARRDRLVEDHLEVGFFELHHGTAQRATVAFEAALDANPGAAEAIAGLTSSLLRLGDPAAALDAIERGEAALERPDLLVRMKARVLRRLGREDEAARLFVTAPEISGTLMWFLEGIALIERGHEVGHETPEGVALFEEAALALRCAVASSPRPRRAHHYQLAIAHGRLKDDRGSMVTARVIEELWPDSPIAWFWIGFATNQTHPERSLAAYRTVVRMDPGNAIAHANVGSAFHRVGNREESVVAYREALTLDPDNAEVQERLSLALIEAKRFEEAVATCKTALATNPEDADFHVNLGTALNGLRRHDEAVAAFREAIRLEPTSGLAHINLGTALIGQGKIKESVASYERGLELDPTNFKGHYNLGNMLRHLGRLEDAAASFGRAIELAPEEPQARVNLGDVLNSLGRHEEAVASCREAVRLAPDMGLAHMNLGHALMGDGKADEAVAAYREASQVDPKNMTFRYNLAVVLAGQGHREEAAKAYREVVKLAPKLAEAHCNLGNLLIDHLGEREEGLAILRRGHELGRARGKSWTYPSARWLEDGVIARASELRESGETQALIALLEEYLKAYPEMSRLRPLLAQAQGQAGR